MPRRGSEGASLEAYTRRLMRPMRCRMEALSLSMWAVEALSSVGAPNTVFFVMKSIPRGGLVAVVIVAPPTVAVVLDGLREVHTWEPNSAPTAGGVRRKAVRDDGRHDHQSRTEVANERVVLAWFRLPMYQTLRIGWPCRSHRNT